MLATGEFGRTPKINGNAGRDHWPQAMCAVLAGGGIVSGQVVGASDATGSEPDGDGFSPDDLAATFYRAIGIDPKTEFEASSGRPITLIRDGNPSADCSVDGGNQQIRQFRAWRLYLGVSRA